MSNPEQEIQLPTDNGEVHHLESRKSALDTYETFYRLYDQPALKIRGISTVLSRVLHIDETEDRSTHFVVAKYDGRQRPIQQHYNRLGVPRHHVPYSSKDILVASTDGISITEYDVLGAYGTYRAHLQADQSRDPYYETMELCLIPNTAKRSVKHLITAQFNMATGNGAVGIGDQAYGWILSERESTRIRNIILTPELAISIGHTANAS